MTAGFRPKAPPPPGRMTGHPEPEKPRLTGCDNLRAWLATQGFQFSEDGLRNRDNACNWYAYRRSAIPARECELNEGKRMQLVVKPHRYRLDGRDFESVEVDVCGEAGGVWFKLKAYSLKPNELQERLGDAEASLIAAWNALRTSAK